ncbi:hypothetical protein EZV77_32450 [Burkholderia thailandensis]|nr:hypothetical protein CWD92_08570 [Burkholderia thailandensis]TBW54705.1 hypothetical protein EZV77_32450 [Burkholderia thailandensis]
MTEKIVVPTSGSFERGAAALCMNPPWLAGARAGYRRRAGQRCRFGPSQYPETIESSSWRT